MTKYEELHENLEDAVFSMLMYELAEQEGERLLAEDDMDNTVVIPKDLDARCRNVIHREFARRKRRSTAKAVTKAVRKATSTLAMLVLIVSALAVSAFAAFPSVRVELLEVLIEISDVSSKLSIVDKNNPAEPVPDNIQDEDAPETVLGYSMPSLSKGFSFEDMRLSEDGRGARIRYYSADDARMINISISDGQTINVDSEDADRVEEITVNGFDGLLIEKANRVNIVWIDLENTATINLNCYNMDSSDVQRIAEQIRFCGEADT